MKTPGKESCGPLPQKAALFLKNSATKDLGKIQSNTEKIHNYFADLNKGKITKEQFQKNVVQLLRDTFECIQDLSNLNIAFPTLLGDDQVTVLNDLKTITTALNLEHPNADNFTEFDNGQIGGAATILQQQLSA